MTLKTSVTARVGTTAEWASGPTLHAGEIGIDTTLGVIKVGDGSSDWATLKAQGGGRTIVGNATLVGGTVTVSGLTGVTSTSEAQVTTKSLGTVSVPSAFRATPGSGTLVITASQGTDTSVVSYAIVVD